MSRGDADGASLEVLLLAQVQTLRRILQQYSMDLLERRSLFGVPVPATQHELVDGVGTHGRLRQVDLGTRVYSVAGSLSPILGDLGHKAADTLDGVPIHRRAQSHNGQFGNATVARLPVASGPGRTRRCFQ